MEIQIPISFLLFLLTIMASIGMISFLCGQFSIFYRYKKEHGLFIEHEVLKMSNKKSMIVAFDVDGTLKDETGRLRGDIILLLKAFTNMKNVTVYVWSGGGKNYAQGMIDRLEMNGKIFAASKTEASSIQADLCFDDMEVALAKINIKV